jgi:ferric-dicitrate binding protein FerR (iron transport regulator)
MIDQDLIDKFFKNKCSVVEKEQVAAYFEKNPEALEAYLNDNEWEQFEANKKLEDSVSERILAKINRMIDRKRTIIRTIRRVMAAASIIVVVGFGWKLLNIQNTKPNNNTIAVEKINNESTFILEKASNTSTQNEQLVMEDGSVVELAPNSSLAYYKPFVKENKRTIFLTGEALFRVAKDKTKPFTVFSGAIATTALGTSFTIKAFEKDSYIKVHLHTGKVVVKASDSMNKKWEKDRFLLPNNVLMYNKMNGLANVNLNSTKASITKANDKSDNNFRTPNWFMFSNQSLSQVFDQLEEIYGVSITYSNKDLRNMYFIGKFDKTDSVESILNTIALLNNLTVKKQNGIYTISK